MQKQPSLLFDIISKLTSCTIGQRQRFKILIGLWTGNTWWRHQMETFSALLAICAGNSPVPGEFPTQRPVTRSFDAYFDLRPNKRLRKQSWGWWFETLSPPLRRHRNETAFHEGCKINARLWFQFDISLLRFAHSSWIKFSTYHLLSSWVLIDKTSNQHIVCD